jgi:putative hydrolase of HD superfamily
MIVHIINRNKYEEIENENYYSPRSIEDEEFIHCSDVIQVEKVADFNFDCSDELVILLIDEAKLDARLVYEDLYNLNELYPHIYGALNLDAVVSVHEFKCFGTKFSLPKELLKYTVEIKEITMADFSRYRELYHPTQRHHLFNGPYFGLLTIDEYEADMEELKKKIENKETHNHYLFVNGKVVGSVNSYYKSKATNWLEVGINLMDEGYWNLGIGTIAFKMWIDRVFKENPDLVRIGYTTWSGNPGMMQIGEKLGMTQEACYKKARIFQGEYYDSVSYGILREDFYKEEN